jgi:hypothetical protein
MWIVALPANIFFAMGGHINGRHALAGRTLIMALSAEFPLIRLCRYHRSGRDLVLFRRCVANGTGNQRMIRCGLDPFNLRMTGGAGAGRRGRFRVMRVMAGYTRFPPVMRIRVDLRETGRPGGVVIVAVGTVVALSRRRGFYFRGIVDMFLRGAVAGFAEQIPMVADLF